MMKKDISIGSVSCRRKSQDCYHYKILSNLDKWEDPWVFAFQMDTSCDWWEQFNGMTKAIDELDCENPVPGKKRIIR